MIHIHIAMKMVCQNLLRLDNLHYHVYTYMNLSSSIKLEPFYKLHLVLLEEHCATSCLVMADCGALLSHKKRTTPMCHVEEHCYKWNLHKMTFWILVQKQLLWSFMIFWYLWLSWGCCFQRCTMESAKGCSFGWLSPSSNINILPYANCATIDTSLNLWTPLPSCSRLSSGQYERLGATGHPPLIPHHSLRRNPESSEFWDPKSFPFHCVSHIQLTRTTFWKNASLKSQPN